MKILKDGFSKICFWQQKWYNGTQCPTSVLHYVQCGPEWDSARKDLFSDISGSWKFKIDTPKPSLSVDDMILNGDHPEIFTKSEN
jgi:hypothetical protein